MDKSKKKKKGEEFEDIMNDLEQQEPQLSPPRYKKITKKDREEDIKTIQEFLVSQLLKFNLSYRQPPNV